MLVALACALVVGIAAAGLGTPSVWAWGPLGLGLGLARRPVARSFAALCLALGAGLAAQGLQFEAARRAARLPPVEAVVEGRVVARASALEPRWIDLAEVTGLRGVTRLRLHANAAGDLDRWLPGDRLRVRARWSGSRPLRNPGREGALAERWRTGRAASGSLAHPSLAVALPGRPDASRWLHGRRREIARELRAAGDRSGLLQGLALGDRSAIAAPTRDAFRRLGLAHVLAVSGLHLLWVAAAAYGVARRVLGRSSTLAARMDTRRLALLSALGAALLYAALAGWQVPVRRAAILLAAASAAIARGRPQRPAAPLALALLWIGVDRPEAVFELGAQLSFAVVAALMLDRGGSGGELGGPPGARSLRRTATAGLVAAPILAWHGVGASLVGLAANVLALPWLGGVLLPAALGAALACAAGLPGSAALAGAAAQLGEITQRGLSAAAAGLPDPTRPALGAAGWLVGAALGAVGLAQRGTAKRAAVAALQVGWLALAPVAGIEPPQPRLVVLDVGQGDSAVIQGRRGALLIDAGGARGDWNAGRVAVVPALRALGVQRLALVIATHADLDHRGGLPAVLEALPVDELWLPAGRGDEPAFAEVREAARSRGTLVREVGRGDPPRRVADLVVEPLWPARGRRHSRNADSLVVRLRSAKGWRVLAAGDLDAAAEARLVGVEADLGADVLLAPHHGSRGSGSELFLDAVSPRLVIASAACRNRFGMPHPELRRRLAARGLPLHWTGRDGALLVSLGERLAARGTGPPQPCP